MKKFLELMVVFAGILAVAFGCSQQKDGSTEENTEFINLKVTGMT